MVFIFTVLTGLVYPLVVTAIGQLAFHDKAEGSLVEVDGRVVGSSLIGQLFTVPEYFHPRPFAAGDGYDGGGEFGLEPGTDQSRLLGRRSQERIVTYREENALDDDVAVPVDAVTASASGLDPHISVANAELRPHVSPRPRRRHRRPSRT